MHWKFVEPPRCHDWLKNCIDNLNLNKIVKKILLNYSFNDENDLSKFLNPSLKNLEDPSSIENLIDAVKIIANACKANKRIVIISDYDVDGVTSMALMWRFFSKFEYTFIPIFPSRNKEGYGLTSAVVKRILQLEKFDYLIAMDCGTNSVEQIANLVAAGIKVIVIDHHQYTNSDSTDALIVNPHINEHKHSKSSLALCTAGLVFKFIHAWAKLLKLDKNYTINTFRLREFLDLVALGTISDLVPLINDNRLFVFFGLKELSNTKSVGLKSFLNILNHNSGDILGTEDVAFQFGPRINVGGRLDSALKPFELLISDDEIKCKNIAANLNALNAKRKEIENTILKEAEKIIATKAKQFVYVLYQPTWELGVVGIVAGKLTKKYNRPVFILGNYEGYAKGSGRSIPEINLINMFNNAKHMLLHFGGHPSAVGLAVKVELLDELEKFLSKYVEKFSSKIENEQCILISSKIKKEDITEKFLNDLQVLEPFGFDNEKPMFALDNFTISKWERFGKNSEHIRAKLSNKIELIGWQKGELDIPINKNLDLAVDIKYVYWNFERRLQMQLIDWHMHT